MKVYAAIATIALGLTVGCSQQPSFAQLDANSDGMISTEEAQSASGLVQVFAEADSNEDGMLNEEEFAAVMGAPAAETAGDTSTGTQTQQ